MEVTEAKNAEELIEETLKVMSDKKDTQKALKDSVSEVLERTNGDKYDWNIVNKVYANKGEGWVAGNPLNLDKDNPHKDAISSTFKKLAETITAFAKFDQLDVLEDYFEALRNLGINIQVDESQIPKQDLDGVDIKDYLTSQKAYIKTIEEYSTELREVHTAVSEDLNFAPKTEYLKLVGIYKRGIEGKDVDDAVQDKLTHCEWTETAYNLVKEKIDSSLPSEE